MGNLLDKLVRVSWDIYIYRKEEDSPFHEVNIDVIPFDTLKAIVPPHENDPSMCDGYELTLDQLDQINAYLDEKIETDFNLYT
jgi:hypothetical protein